MENNIYSLEEIREAARVSSEEFELWEKQGLVQPIGQTPDKVPFFGSETLEKISHITRFVEMGYSLEEIRKILRKVGLPETVRKKEGSGGKEQFLTVGSLAEQAGVSPRTIKHWEDKGIIEADMRSQGGFRLFRTYYVFFCQLIQDLQLFGYSLDQIKEISDYFRDFIRIRDNIDSYPPAETERRMSAMLDEISRLLEKTGQLKAGIDRWEDLLKKHRRQIINLKDKKSKKREDTE